MIWVIWVIRVIKVIRVIRVMRVIRVPKALFLTTGAARQGLGGGKRLLFSV